jgi:outer membrane murein-binding lipoprotein Lpp
MLKILLHPATTIVFTIAAVAVGIVVIRNSAKEDSKTIYTNAAHIEEMRDLSSLKSTVNDLAETVDGLNKRVSAIEDRLPATSKQRKTATTLTVSPNPSTSGKAVTFTAVVTPSPPDGETVSFTTGAKLLGTALLTGGSATLTTLALPVGTTQIKAVYRGDSNFSPSSSNVLRQVVKK